MTWFDDEQFRQRMFLGETLIDAYAAEGGWKAFRTPILSVLNDLTLFFNTLADHIERQDRIGVNDIESITSALVQIERLARELKFHYVAAGFAADDLLAGIRKALQPPEGEQDA